MALCSRQPPSLALCGRPLWTRQQPPYRLADIVARWPEKTQAQWRAEEWKAGRSVKLVLDTINGQG